MAIEQEFAALKATVQEIKDPCYDRPYQPNNEGLRW